MFDLRTVVDLIKSFRKARKSYEDSLAEMNWLRRRICYEAQIHSLPTEGELSQDDIAVADSFIKEIEDFYPDHINASQTFTHEEAIRRGIEIYSLPDNLLNQIKEKSLPLPSTETQAN